MNEVLQQAIGGLRFGRLKSRGPLAILPVFLPDGGGPDCLTLGEALERKVLSVGEMEGGGRVPELRVVNRGEKPVLLLDGEELRGAKQNRVLNTTILVPERSECVVPVSCTEQGRWRTVSAEFQDSGVVMARHIRAAKNRSVAFSLEREGSFRGNQGQVWSDIAELSCKAGVRSGTAAMRDVFQAREGDLEDLTRAFGCAEGQAGMAVFLHGEVAGFELFSNPRVFGLLFPKLLRSYAVEALTERGGGRRRAARAKARAFLDRLAGASVSRRPSVGCGEDLRFRTDGVVGAALLVDGVFVHAAFFSFPAEPRRMDGSRRHGVGGEIDA